MPRVATLGQIEDALEWAVRRPFGHDGTDRSFTDALDRAEAKRQLFAVNGELNIAEVHAGRNDLDPHAAAVFDVLDQLVGLPQFARQQGRHELLRVVRLEVRRLIGHRAVGRAVRLVEAVTGELLDHAEQFGRLRLAEAVLECPRQKLAAVLGDGLQFFLADRLDALIRLRQVDPAEPVQNPHDLFLVDHHAVGLVHDRIDDRMNARQRLLAVLDLHVGHDHAPFERAGPVEGRRGDDVGELVGLHLGQQVAHPARLKLEDSFGFAPLKQCERGFVVERQLDRIDLNAAMLCHILHGLVEDREVAQTEEVHLQQSGLLDRRAFPLRDDVSLAGDRLQRDVLGDRAVRDDNTRRVRAGTARQALDLLGEVQNLPDLRVRVVQLPQLGAFLDRFVERDVQRLGNHLGDDIDILG